MFNASWKISGGGKECDRFLSDISDSGVHKISSLRGSCGESESLAAVIRVLVLLGFSGSIFSGSSVGGFGDAGGAAADRAFSPSALGILVDDARRFHVREGRCSFLGNREGLSASRRVWLCRVDVLSSDRDRRMT